MICILTIIFFDGTADSGDSIVHYLFARYAPAHPKLFFDHWAKPLFVILASPFAQFGFGGIKVFNAINSVITIIYTYKVTELLKIKNPVIVIILMMFAPLNYILTFSGLTEPLFAMFLILGIYFCLKEKYVTASLIISFLPYVRSEGLIIIGIFGLYFMLIKKWKSIPFLITGSAVISIAGYFVYHDLLWVFTKIPYATLNSVYGSGTITHFAEKLVYVVGVPICVLVWIGFSTLVIKLFRKKANTEEFLFLLSSFSLFLIAHSLFWYLGIFNSYGLIRVMISIMPVMAIIALMGFNALTESFIKTEKIGIIIKVIVLGYILIFPFAPHPAAIQWEEKMMLQGGQLRAMEVADFISKNNQAKYPIIYSHPALSMALNLDPFDENKVRKFTRENISGMRSGELLIWDNVFVEFESGIKKSDLDAMPELTQIFLYKTEKGPEVVYSGYMRK